MPRHKYTTDEERQNAIRDTQHKYYLKKKDDEEFMKKIEFSISIYMLEITTTDTAQSISINNGIFEL